jgi:hypothetical protein
VNESLKNEQEVNDEFQVVEFARYVNQSSLVETPRDQEKEEEEEEEHDLVVVEVQVYVVED